MPPAASSAEVSESMHGPFDVVHLQARAGQPDQGGNDQFFLDVAAIGFTGKSPLSCFQGPHVGIIIV